jgi:hypothetical protein
MSTAELHARISACQQSVLLFYYGVDRGDFPLAMAQFSQDCVWDRSGVLLRGPQEVEASLRNRPATQVTRHIVSNFALIRGNAERVTAVYTLGLHLYDDGTPPALPVPGSLPFMLVDVTCELGLEPDNAWRIRQLDIQRTFRYAQEVTSPLLKPKRD